MCAAAALLSGLLDYEIPEPPKALPTPDGPEEDAVTANAVRRARPRAQRPRGLDIFEVPPNNILPS